jgi:hypothetical protein
MEQAYRVIIKGQEFFFKIEILEIMNHDESYESITIALKQLREEEDKSKLN